MDKYEVEITNEALENMDKIYNYITKTLLAPENAIGQYDRIANAILTLGTFPENYKLFDSEPEHSWGLHRMVVDNYLVCYLIDPGIVTITDVLYGASDVPTRLEERHI